MPHGSCNNWRFRGTYCLHHQVDKNWRARSNISSNYQPKHMHDCKLVVPRFFSNSCICSSETSARTRTTWPHIPEDVILHKYHHEKFKSYRKKLITFWDLFLKLQATHQALALCLYLMWLEYALTECTYTKSKFHMHLISMTIVSTCFQVPKSSLPLVKSWHPSLGIWWILKLLCYYRC
jgi:hypothetical protein